MVKDSHETDCCLTREPNCCPPCPPACDLPKKHCKECFTKCDLKFAGVGGCPIPFDEFYGGDILFGNGKDYLRDLSVDPCFTILRKNAGACTHLHYCARTRANDSPPTVCITLKLVEIDHRHSKCGCQKPVEKVLKEVKCITYAAWQTDCCLDWVGEICPDPCVTYAIRFYATQDEVELHGDMGYVKMFPKKVDQKALISCGLNKFAQSNGVQYKPARCLKNDKPRTFSTGF